MSDEGEKTCPLCDEEMDLTDQQLKPCKCGYEICVWCWHHIMDMAEKDETEGRCPACRTPYNKEKIVGTAAKCERLVSEINVEKRLKSQRGKSKTSEGRKQLGSVRVIQRNLVYVVGLPLDLADEDLLQRREYFGQYGKVLKVSISRTTTGAIQQFANSTCSVYITYSKEEEAVRCIQFVHGFVLDGRPLRACFGTTKYCHAWLRNVPCSNPDCLYLHEVGSQEDSFTKDEIISAYTRSRIQQVTGASNSTQRRPGNVLPPPDDEFCNISSVPSGNSVVKTAVNTNNSAMNPRISPPNSSSGRSTALPAGASWGTRPSNNQPLPASPPCSNGPSTKKPDMPNGPVASSKAVASQVSLFQGGAGNKKLTDNESMIYQDKSKTDTYEPVKRESKLDGRVNVSDSSVPSAHLANFPSSSQPHSPPTTESLLDTSNVFDSSIASSVPASNKGSVAETDVNVENLSCGILSLGIHENHKLQNDYIEHTREPLNCRTSGKAANTSVQSEELCTASVQSDFRLGMPSQATHGSLHELEDDLLTFDSQRIKDPQIATHRAPVFSNSFNLKQSNISSPAFGNADGLVGMSLDRHVVDRNNNLVTSTSNFPSSRPENIFYNSEDSAAEDSNFCLSNEKRSLLGRYEAKVGNGAVDAGESSIISNILSMDDPWNESLTSPQNLAMLLGETDRRQGSFGAPGSRKVQNSNQSRFSFAREEEPMSHVSDFGQSIGYNEQAFRRHSFGHNFSTDNRLHLEKSGSCNGLPGFGGTYPDYFASNQSNISSNKLSVSKSEVSAPPGFSVPSRAAPPGFLSHERTEQIFESLSGNHMFDASTLSRNQYQMPSSGSTFSNGDVEFIDPAILAVGKGTLAGGINNPGLDIRSSYSPQFSTYEEARFQSLLQRSLPPHQNQRFNNPQDNFSALGDVYGIPSRIVEQTLSNNVSPFSQFTVPQTRNGIMSNGQWDGWNEAHIGNNLGMAELLRTERLGLNKFYGGYEEPKIRMPSSGNLYNGAYGI